MNLNKTIDHTALKADTSFEDIKKLCEEALKYDFASVCVNSCWVAYAKETLDDSDVKVCTVTGFPLGATSIKAKKAETLAAISEGAQEIDTVINIAKVIEGDWDYITTEMKELSNACRDKGVCLKVILETCLLNDAQISKVEASWGV